MKEVKPVVDRRCLAKHTNFWEREDRLSLGIWPGAGAFDRPDPLRPHDAVGEEKH